MTRDLWRARLGKSTCLAMIVLAAGCRGTQPTRDPRPAEIGPLVQPQIVPPALEAPRAVEPASQLAESGPTVLERLAQAQQDLDQQRRRNVQLEEQLQAERARLTEAERSLAQKTEAVDRLQRQLADMDQAIEEVRAEAAAAEGLRPQLLVLQAQLEAAHDELTARKKELLQLTLKLEDIYRVLIREFEQRVADEVVIRPQ